MRVERLHCRPEGSFHHGVLEDVAHVGHRAVEMHAIEREALGRVGLGAGPVASLEAVGGPGGDLAESQAKLIVGGVNRRDGSRSDSARHPVADLG